MKMKQSRGRIWFLNLVTCARAHNTLAHGHTQYNTRAHYDVHLHASRVIWISSNTVPLLCTNCHVSKEEPEMVMCAKPWSAE